jgi:hypothetical protein
MQALPAFTEVVRDIICEPLQATTSAQKANIDGLRRDIRADLDRLQQDLRGGNADSGALPPSLVSLATELKQQQELTAALQQAMQLSTDELRTMTAELTSAIADVARVGEATALEAARSARRQWAFTIVALVVLVVAGIFIDPHVGT